MMGFPSYDRRYDEPLTVEYKKPEPIQKKRSADKKRDRIKSYPSDSFKSKFNYLKNR